MRFKTWILLLALGTAPLAAQEPGAYLIDKVAAVVNDEIITYSDVEKAILFYPELLRLEKTEETFTSHIIEELVNYRVVYLEYRDEFTLGDDDIELVQTPILGKIGSMEKLRDILRGFDMEWADFQVFIREKVLYEKVLRERFMMNISVEFSDIEAFYQNE